MNILFVNACVRGAESNTLTLCKAAIAELQSQYPDATVEEVNLGLDRPVPLYAETLKRRSELRKAGDVSDPIFAYAKQFAKADKIIVGAPYWEMAFPAVLKIYIELISVGGLTFEMGERGAQGLCKADQLLYISSAGGPISDEINLGFHHWNDLCKHMYGIEETKCFMMDCVDMGGDIAAMVEESTKELRPLVSQWFHR